MAPKKDLPYTYRFTTLNITTVLQKMQIDGEKIVYAGPSNGENIRIRLNSQDNDAIILSPKSLIIAPFTRFYYDIASGSQAAQIFIASPKGITLERGDLIVDTINILDAIRSPDQIARAEAAIVNNGTFDIAARATRRELIVQADNGNTGALFLATITGQNFLELNAGDVTTLSFAGAVRIRNTSGTTQTYRFAEFYD